MNRLTLVYEFEGISDFRRYLKSSYDHVEALYYIHDVSYTPLCGNKFSKSR
jgi:hypothetical protein